MDEPGVVAPGEPQAGAVPQGIALMVQKEWQKELREQEASLPARQEEQQPVRPVQRASLPVPEKYEVRLMRAAQRV